jgi:serine protease Do
MVRLLYSLLLIIIFSLPCLAKNQLWSNSDKKIDQETLTVGSNPIQSWAPLVTKVAPTVVNISGKVPEKGRNTKSLGSGFIINKNGYIVTAAHIINNATEIKVTPVDNHHFDAKIIGRDRFKDLALLKIEAGGNLSVAILGDSGKLSVGDFAITIGNPFGSWPTASVGIISALGCAEVISTMRSGCIQTDASINPSNAGGPMFNIDGEVIGVNIAVIKNSNYAGFAIPINVVKNTLKKFFLKY